MVGATEAFEVHNDNDDDSLVPERTAYVTAAKRARLDPKALGSELQVRGVSIRGMASSVTKLNEHLAAILPAAPSAVQTIEGVCLASCRGCCRTQHILEEERCAYCASTCLW